MTRKECKDLGCTCEWWSDNKNEMVIKNYCCQCPLLNQQGYTHYIHNYKWMCS